MPVAQCERVLPLTYAYEYSRKTSLPELPGGHGWCSGNQKRPVSWSRETVCSAQWASRCSSAPGSHSHAPGCLRVARDASGCLPHTKGMEMRMSSVVSDQRQSGTGVLAAFLGIANACSRSGIIPIALRPARRCPTSRRRPGAGLRAGPRRPAARGGRRPTGNRRLPSCRCLHRHGWG
jgi:hypothetical protein